MVGHRSATNWDGTTIARFHGAVPVVSAVESVLPGTRESVERARDCHLPVVAFALTRCDLVEDPELLDLVTVEVRDLLTKYGARGDEVPAVPMRFMRNEQLARKDARGDPFVGAAGMLAALRVYG